MARTASKRQLLSGIVLSRVRWERHGLAPCSARALSRQPLAVVKRIAEDERLQLNAVETWDTRSPPQRIYFKMLQCLPPLAEAHVRRCRAQMDIANTFVELSRVLRQIPVREDPFVYHPAISYVSVHMTDFRSFFGMLDSHTTVYMLLMESGCRDDIRRDVMFNAFGNYRAAIEGLIRLLAGQKRALLNI